MAESPRDVFPRTTCGCRQCVACCEHIPGFLIPGDYVRIQAYLGKSNDPKFFKRHFAASDGALVEKDGKRFRIPTIVPASKPDGSCVFLTADKKCLVHVVAPYGCAVCDMHQDPTESTRRSSAGLQAILTDGDYGYQWWYLKKHGQPVRSVEARRESLRVALAVLEGESHEV